MQTTFDRDSNCAYIRFSALPIVGSEEISPGIVFDFAEDGRAVGCEIIGLGLKKIAIAFWAICHQLLFQMGSMPM